MKNKEWQNPHDDSRDKGNINNDQILPWGTNGENKKEIGIGAKVEFKNEIRPITNPRNAPLRHPRTIEPIMTGI